MTAKSVLAATALLAAVNLTACTTTTGRSIGRNVDDASITAAVEANLAGDKGRSLTTVDVDTVAGTVYLNGTVKDMSSKRKAEALAREVRGVKRVVNNLQARSSAAGDGPSAR